LNVLKIEHTGSKIKTSEVHYSTPFVLWWCVLRVPGGV